MTTTLKKQLTLLCGASLLAVGVGIGARELKAQNESPKSAVEAAQLFGRLLAANDPDDKGGNNDRWLSYRILSQSDREKLGSSSYGALLSDLQVESKRTNYDAISKRKEGNTTVVDIAPATKPAALPVVIVQEQGGYRVDLLATYAKRKKLGDGALQTAVFQQTGVALDGLPGLDTPYVQNKICQTNMKQFGLGLLQYMQDYDELLPPAKRWEENVYPYVGNTRMFNCPATPAKKGGYAYNSVLSMKKIQDIDSSYLTIMAYETKTTETNTFGTGDDLVFRHKTYDGGAVRTNLLFVDGHVQGYPDTKKFDFSLNPPVPQKVEKS